MSRKRDKPYSSRPAPYSFPKRRRPLPPALPAGENDLQASKTLTTIVVSGLSPECSVLDLKSRFQIYGTVSRTRIDPGGFAYVIFRSKDSAESAIAAATEPSFGISLNSQRVQVMWASDPVPLWRRGVGYKDGSSLTSSKLVRAEPPLRKHGRGNKLSSTIVNPRADEPKFRTNVDSDGGSRLGLSFGGREIIAYDDIL